MGQAKRFFLKMSMEAYLNEKKVDQILTDAVIALGRERPEQPVAFLVDYLGQKYLGILPKSSDWEQRAAVVDEQFVEADDDLDGDAEQFKPQKLRSSWSNLLRTGGGRRWPRSCKKKDSKKSRCAKEIGSSVEIKCHVCAFGC